MLRYLLPARRWAGALALGSVLAMGGCATISTQQEAQLGAQAAADVNRQLPIVQDAQINNYINQLGNTIASRADPSGRSYRFYVVNAKEVNAFALPGGYVYVNRGLIDRTDNMSELAGVLGHEIGHVVERHGVTQVERAQNANLGLAVVYGVLLGRNPSTLEQVGIQGVGSAIFAGYSRDAEREADQDAVKFVVNAGINPQGIPSFFQKLLSEQQRQPSAVERWFSTHPLTQERLQTAQTLVAQVPASQRQNLTTDTQAYRDFRARVRSLPAPTQ